MLQQRIGAERERGDADPGRHAGDGGGSLVDQLARALDYRRWHRFRVERLQDGQWRKLSGPAASGERALGLTVPLFAAIASFYSEGSNPHAPRLMLPDEACAGIADAARAHCMARGLPRKWPQKAFASMPCGRGDRHRQDRGHANWPESRRDRSEHPDAALRQPG